MSLPCFIAETIVVRAVPAKVHALVPAAVAGTFAVLLNIPECEKLAAGVVKYSVYDYPDACLMAESREMAEAFVCAEPAVCKPVIPGVVAMGGGLKERSDVKGGAACGFHVGNPLVQFRKAVGCGVFGVDEWRPQHTQRVNVIKNCFVIP